VQTSSPGSLPYQQLLQPEKDLPLAMHGVSSKQTISRATNSGPSQKSTNQWESVMAFIEQSCAEFIEPANNANKIE